MLKNLYEETVEINQQSSALLADFTRNQMSMNRPTRNKSNYVVKETNPAYY